jgi:hypothetical protein
MSRAFNFDYEAANARLIELVEMREANPQRIADILRAAVRLIRDGWCRRAGAKTASGGKVYPTQESAGFFDAGGAIVRAASDLGAGWQDALSAQKIIEALVHSNIVEWNDDPRTTQEHVEMAFLRALHRIQNFEQHKAKSA